MGDERSNAVDAREPLALQDTRGPRTTGIGRAEPLERRFAHVRPIDLGEQIVGSRHRIVGIGPMNEDVASGPALLHVQLLDSNQSLRLDGEVHVAAPGLHTQIPFEFAPKQKGAHWSAIELSARWKDDHHERFSVPVRASARELDDVPEGEVGANAAKSKAHGSLAPRPDVNAPYDAAFEDEGKHLDAVMGFVIAEQRQAIVDVAAEAQKYERRPEAPSMWWDLLEIALVMGTSGIAAALGRFASSKILGGVEHAAETSAGSVATKEAEEAVDHVAADAGVAAARATQPVSSVEATVDRVSADARVAGPRATAAAQAARGAVSPSAEHAESLTAEGLSTAIEDGLKHPVERALEEVSGERGKEGKGSDEARDGTASSDESGGDSPTSQDGDIAFFSEQQSVLNRARISMQEFGLAIQQHLRPILRTSPAAARQGIATFASSVLAAGEIAKPIQARATAAQFVAYRARASLGATAVRTPDRRPKEVTDMEPARRFDRTFAAPGAFDGLLDIVIELKGASVRVLHARMEGVSQLVADRLLKMDLVALHVPLRIVVDPNAGFITRDEAGRIRASGFAHLTPDWKAGFDEAQEHRGAEQIAHTVLSKPLSAWGIHHVETDDVSGKHK